MMDSLIIEEKVRKILVQIRNLEIEPSDLPDDLSDIDSLNLLEFIVQIEEEFSIELEDEDIEFQNTMSVSLIVNFIEKKLETNLI